MIAMNPAGPALAVEDADGEGSSIGKAVSSLGDGGGGSDLGAIVLLLVLALAIFLASGYLVWMGPEIFTEAAFGAMLAGGLARGTREQSEAGWVAGVVKKTWWPFAIVLALALTFAFYSASHHPGAKTFREAIRMTVS